MDAKPAAADVVVAQIAARQHGVVRLDQLRWAGLSPTQIRTRVLAGRLHRVHRGVYAVGHPKLSPEGRWLAAVLACGPAAALSHDSAAALWQLSSPTSPSWVHVTIPEGSSRARRDGIVLHRSRTLTSRDTTLRHSIPVTTPQRTRRDMGWGSEPTRSWLERRFLRLIKDAGLPVPEVNEPIGPYTVDYLWRRHELVVEADSWGHHSDRTAFETDRQRDRYLQSLGYAVLRFTYREISDSPATVIASLRAQLFRVA